LLKHKDHRLVSQRFRASGPPQPWRDPRPGDAMSLGRIEYRAFIQDANDPLRQAVGVYIWREHDRALLDPIGVWQPQQVEGGPAPMPTFMVPREAMEALVEAIDAWRGQPSHAKTEAAVLREWLEYERGRVDKVFEAVGRPIIFDTQPMQMQKKP
jgi:hypothetical protein